MLWKTKPVEEQPEITLTFWHLIKVAGDDLTTLHLIGRADTGGGRVSSAILDFDQERLVAKTVSGRVYKLEGAQSIDDDALYVLEHWIGNNSFSFIRLEEVPFVAGACNA